MQGSYLGPEFSQDEIERRLTAAGARFTTLCECELIDASASALAEGKALGWFQGRMEFGPRARWGPARFWATRGRPPCRACSI